MDVDSSRELRELAERELERDPELRRSAAGALDRVRAGLGVRLVEEDELRWPEGPGPDTPPCFAPVTSGVKAGELCDRYAGAGTDHLGVGRCWRHGGRDAEGIREAGWIVGHAFARALDVTPWEGLLTAVRIAAGRVAFIEAKLAGAQVDRQLEPAVKDSISEAGRTQDQQGSNMHYWVKQAEYWVDRLAKLSKLAIDAGVAERLVRQVELEAQLMLRATNLTLDELGLDEETRQRVLVTMSRHLLELERREVHGDLDGDIVGSEDK